MSSSPRARKREISLFFRPIDLIHEVIYKIPSITTDVGTEHCPDNNIDPNLLSLRNSSIDNVITDRY